MKHRALIFLLFLAAFLIAFHQYSTWGYWWEWKDLHHETWIIMFSFSGLLLAVIKKYRMVDEH